MYQNYIKINIIYIHHRHIKIMLINKLKSLVKKYFYLKYMFFSQPTMLSKASNPLSC